MSDARDWLSWPQAAEAVGCPVPTIDWYVRQGRIKHRPARGRRPSLEAASVEEFAVWWRERQTVSSTRRSERRRRSAEWLGPPEPTGWLSMARAAEVLGVAETHVPWLIDQGRLRGVTLGHRRWVNDVSVHELLEARKADDEQWLSHTEAAEIVGCSTNTIMRMVKAGRIEKREAARAVPSLRRSSVEQFARTWRAASRY